MKMVFFCAGRGNRLCDLTKDSPKCLLPVAGEVLMGRWLRRFSQWKVQDVLVNLHYRPDKIFDFLKNWNWDGVRISLSYEKELLGSARTLYENRKFVRGDYYFGVVYSDVWTAFDLRKMITFHKRRAGMVTLALHEPETLEGKGIAIVRNGLVVGFEEKSKNPKSNVVWAGIMLAHPSIFREYERGMKDIASDWLPKLCKMGKVNAFFIRDYVRDIGESPESYKRINEEVKRMGFDAL